MQLPLKSFIYLRHGETDWNKRHICMGQTDIPLNETGMKQAQQASSLFEKTPPSIIISSPLKRAFQTAELIAETLSTPLKTHEGLKEACWGSMEGKDVSDGTWRQNWRSGTHLDGGESFECFAARVLNAFQDILGQHHHPLIVSHGGVYWFLEDRLGFPNYGGGNCQPLFCRAPEKEDIPWFVYPLEGS